MNLSTIQADLYSKLSYQASPNSEVVARLLRFVNETQREILGMKALARLRRTVLTTACVSGSPFMVLPQAAARIRSIQDRTSKVLLQEISLSDLRNVDPGLSASVSSPWAYVIMNLAAPVATDPSTADKLYVISDNAGDTQTAYIEGIVTGGYYQTVSAVVNGVTGVQFGALATWIAITKFYLSAAATGNVKLLQTSAAGSELARIAPGGQYARYSRVQLYGTPSQANTYYVDVELHIGDMANAGDEPYLNEDFHWLIPCGALMKEFTKREKWSAYGIEAARWKRGIEDLTSFANPSTIGNTGSRLGFSQLGPNFRVGS